MKFFRAIIPCVGFGKRMGMLPNQSKEMLIDPKTGQPLIQYHLDLCKKYQLQPLVITRKEKADLNQYLQKNNIPFMIIEPHGEWMHSVLASQGMWDEYNILLLPDTRFEPDNILQEIKNSLELGTRLVFGVHKVYDPNKWGIINNYFITEKPRQSLTGEQYAWGVIGFHIEHGQQLFESMKESKPYKLYNAGFHYFDSFKDITRTGKLE